MKIQVSLWMTVVTALVLSISCANATESNLAQQIVIARNMQPTLSVRDAQGEQIKTFASGVIDENVHLATGNAQGVSQSVAMYRDKQIQLYSVDNELLFSLPVAESGRVAQGQFLAESALLFAPDAADGGELLYKISSHLNSLVPVAIPKSAWQPPVNIATIDIDNDRTDEVVVGHLDANYVAIYRISGELVNKFEVFNDSSRTRRSVREKPVAPGNSCDHNGNGDPNHCSTPAPVTSEPVTAPDVSEPITIPTVTVPEVSEPVTIPEVVAPDPTPPVPPQPESPSLPAAGTPDASATPDNSNNSTDSAETPVIPPISQPDPSITSPPTGMDNSTQPVAEVVTTPSVDSGTTKNPHVIYGVKVVTGDVNGDGKSEIVVGMAH
ncbi:MAG: hypothetical protein R3E08_04540, partial [Thiotrichaceae bacterium]